MIKGSELRTGNRVWESSLVNPTPDDFAEIVIASVNDIDKVVHDEQDNIYSYDYIYPIPLTPEWLELCGFNEGVLYLNPMMTSIRGANKNAEVRYCDAHGNSVSRYYQYLHQLQNLYFTLTDEELEIKLP